MAHFDKETYERKTEYAVKHNMEQSVIGAENGMTEEQTEAMERLCADRHYLHTHTRDLFILESCGHDTVCRMLDPDYESETSISYYLNQVGLKNNLDFDTALPNDHDYEDATLKNDEEKEEAYDSAYSECANFMENVNNKIEQFMRTVDEKYGTQYCPTGIARSAI